MPINEKDIQRVLITGIAGSGGSYLAEYIVDHHPGIQVHGISRWHSTSTASNLRRISGKVRVHECDLTDLSSTLATLESVQPDVIFHLASHANVRASFTYPNAVLANNILGTANLFEAIRILKLDPLVQHCSSAEVYGHVGPEHVPIDERCPFAPGSPYAVSKVTQDLLAFSYFKGYGMRIVRTRMFTYINPRRTDLFATSFARQVARIEAGVQETLYHGNLDSVRTIIDVRDAMESYWVAVLCCQPGEAYNLGGDTTISVGEVLSILKSQAKVPIKSEVDPALLRPSDVTLQIPNLGKFRSVTDWRPRYSIESSLDALLGYWRERALDE